MSVSISGAIWQDLNLNLSPVKRWSHGVTDVLDELRELSMKLL